MAHDDSAPNKKKKPGERPEGTFHYNPGNMAGKTISAGEEGANEQVKSDTKQESQERQKRPAVHPSAAHCGDERILLSKAPPETKNATGIEAT
jgi:hypothetical protein